MVLIRLRYQIFSKYHNLLLFNMLINKFSTVILLWLLETLTLIRLGFLRVVFSGGGQSEPPFIFQEELI